MALIKDGATVEFRLMSLIDVAGGQVDRHDHNSIAIARLTWCVKVVLKMTSMPFAWVN